MSIYRCVLAKLILKFIYLNMEIEDGLGKILCETHIQSVFFSLMVLPNLRFAAKV